MSDFLLKSSPSPEIENEFNLNNPFLTRLLYNRGLRTKAEVETFLNPSYDEHLHDPFLLHDIDKAVVRILRAIQDNEVVVIFSDYDCDGIPGAVVLHDFFKAVGFNNFYNYIPHRHYDGFGLSEKAVLHIKEKYNPTLIITIDCGTTDTEAVKKANDLSVEVIITDHHEPKEKLPEALAIVNPKVSSTYPFTGLCGAGVIYKLIQALIVRGNFSLKAGQEKWWLDMVGVATIADMVPLVGENRVFAHYGLKVLKKTRRPGLQKLLRRQGVNLNFLTEDDIGFTIGPRINAASRMDTPEDAFLLLATTDEVEAETRMLHLEKLNTERKTMVAQMTKELHKRLELKENIPEVFAMGNPDWRPSLVGLSANKLAEEYRRPAFLWGRDGNGMFKGSCRSGGEVSVVRLMEVVPELFHEFGGHHASGGFTIREEKIHVFSEALIDAYKQLGVEAIVKEPLVVDMELSLTMITAQLLNAQKQSAPFGQNNPKPLYFISNVTPKEVLVFGKAKEHTKIVLDNKGLVKEAIAFFKLPKDFKINPEDNKTFSLLAHLEESYFMNRLQVRLRVIDIV